MSATGRGAERRADDFYETPGWCTRAILPHLLPADRCGDMKILDPCAGTGAILREIYKSGQSYSLLDGVEIDEERARACEANGIRCGWGDALNGKILIPKGGIDLDLIITNPPYSLAREFLDVCLSSGTRVVAFLLRINFLGSQDRADWHRAHPCKLYVLPRRPSFTGGGTDATEYAWFVWGEGHEPGTWEILDVEPTERKAGVSHPAKLPVERFERLELL